ncbi:hypothetical protein [Allonocardiopsis opalescens]|uniref:Uncharacterized protein n=1 Tax=Allonocardiopsis opalescens TaxID=1144618 RepID=A0A2T0PXQ9_9ACTN|nr:hypothetical protein [Allonocardiopsis opalescens]PRX96289.1 hypothetical protein CLV72_108296 [Allonocardiopsis opalescens]
MDLMPILTIAIPVAAVLLVIGGVIAFVLDRRQRAEFDSEGWGEERYNDEHEDEPEPHEGMTHIRSQMEASRQGGRRRRGSRRRDRAEEEYDDEYDDEEDPRR